MQSAVRKNIETKSLGSFCVLMSIVIFAISFELIPAIALSLPSIMQTALGLSFLFSGFLLIFKGRGMIVEGITATLLFCIGCIALWAGIYNSDRSILIGFPLFKYDQSLIFAKVIFYLGALVCWILCFQAFKRAMRFANGKS